MRTWAYGVTTVEERRELLERTLTSLARAGFDTPRLFVDGASCYDHRLRVTCRPPPKLGVYGNWILSLWELYIREPDRQLYAVFQDDVLAYRNLRQYFERTIDLNAKRYYNLYAYADNERLAEGRVGWHGANHLGLGALGLVFPRDAVQHVLASTHLAKKPMSVGRGKAFVDGGLVEAMEVEWMQRGEQYRETFHYPTLLQHTGEVSTQITKHGNPRVWLRQLTSSWRGEEFDAMEMLNAG